MDFPAGNDSRKSGTSSLRSGSRETAPITSSGHELPTMNFSRTFGRTLLVLLVLVTAVPLFAWSEKGHYLVNEAATLALPTDMPQFFCKAFPQLIWEGDDPDRWKGAGVSLDAANPPDHFLDYEYVAGLKLPPDRYRFIDLLYRSGTLRRFGIYNSTAGFLPWRIAELSDRLTGEWRQWRATKPGSPERKFLEAGILRDAGILGHYVGDAANPHHTTVNFNGWIVDNPHHYATDCDTHDRFERFWISHAVTLADVSPRVAAEPTLRTNYFAAAMDEIKDSNAHLDLLYRIDRDGGFDLFKPVSKEGVVFASDRIAFGASMLRDFWWSTWKNSAKRRRRGDTDAGE